MTLREMLLEFCTAMGITNPDFPCVPEDKIVHKGMRLVAEEFCELLEAVYGYAPWINDIKETLNDSIGFHRPATDLVEAADAIADSKYVLEAFAQALGINSEPVEAEVHRTNMAKTSGPRRWDGKILKPEGWQPPNIAAVLEAQRNDDRPARGYDYV
jgi:predicted HAD superfamily Cof-like phosphohydrolase